MNIASRSFARFNSAPSGERAFDGIPGSQVLPDLGREVDRRAKHAIGRSLIRHSTAIVGSQTRDRRSAKASSRGHRRSPLVSAIGKLVQCPLGDGLAGRYSNRLIEDFRRLVHAGSVWPRVAGPRSHRSPSRSRAHRRLSHQHRSHLEPAPPEVKQQDAISYGALSHENRR